jgi:hypothetical protein
MILTILSIKCDKGENMDQKVTSIHNYETEETETDVTPYEHALVLEYAPEWRQIARICLKITCGALVLCFMAALGLALFLVFSQGVQ